MDSLKQSLSDLGAHFSSRIAQFEREHKLDTPAPAATVSSLAAEFAAFKTFILESLGCLQRQVEMLSQETDELEMRSRRKMLLLHGVPEAKSEDLSAQVMRVAGVNLNLADLSVDDIARCHRLGRPAGEKPRPIVVKFCDIAVRDSVWFAKTKLKGSGITVSEFLTKARHTLFMTARARVGVAKCWTRNGAVYTVCPDGLKRRITSASDLGIDCTTPSKGVPPTSDSGAPPDGKASKVKRRAAPKK